MGSSLSKDKKPHPLATCGREAWVAIHCCVASTAPADRKDRPLPPMVESIATMLSPRFVVLSVVENWSKFYLEYYPYKSGGSPLDFSPSARLFRSQEIPLNLDADERDDHDGQIFTFRFPADYADGRLSRKDFIFISGRGCLLAREAINPDHRDSKLENYYVSGLMANIRLGSMARGTNTKSFRPVLVAGAASGSQSSKPHLECLSGGNPSANLGVKLRDQTYYLDKRPLDGTAKATTDNHQRRFFAGMRSPMAVQCAASSTGEPAGKTTALVVGLMSSTEDASPPSPGTPNCMVLRQCPVEHHQDQQSEAERSMTATNDISMSSIPNPEEAVVASIHLGSHECFRFIGALRVRAPGEDRSPFVVAMYLEPREYLAVAIFDVDRKRGVVLSTRSTSTSAGGGEEKALPKRLVETVRISEGNAQLISLPDVNRFAYFDDGSQHNRSTAGERECIWVLELSGYAACETEGAAMPTKVSIVSVENLPPRENYPGSNGSGSSRMYMGATIVSSTVV